MPEIDPGDDRGPARHRRHLPQRTRAVGGAVETLQPAHRGRSDGRRIDEQRADRAVRAARPARGRRCWAAQRGDRRLAQGAASSIRATSARSRRSRRCSRRRRAGRSAIEVLERQARGARRPRGAGRDAAAGGRNSGQTRRSATLERRPRSTSACARPTRPTRLASDGSRSSTASRTAGTSSSSCCSARVESADDPKERSSSFLNGRRDLRAGAGRPGERVRRAAGGLPRGLLERSGGPGAGAPGHGGRQVERAARSTPRWSRAHRGRRQAADLWVKIGRWYGRAADRTSTTPSPRRSRRCSSTRRTSAPWRRWPTSSARRGRWRELVEGAAAPRRGRAGPREEGRAPTGAGRAPRDASCGDAGQADRGLPAGAGPTSARIDAIERARAALPPHEQLGAADRGARRKAERHRRRRAGGASCGCRSASSGRSGSATPGQAIGGLQGGAHRRSAEPPGAEGARAALREDRPARGLPRRPRAPARGDRPRRSDLALPAHGAAWEEQFGKPERAGRVPARRSCSSTAATTAPTAIWSGSTGEAATGTRWSRPTAATSRSRPTRGRASSSTSRWARSTRRSCSDLDRAIEAYNDILSLRRRPRRRARRRWPALRADRASGIAPST